VADPFSEYVPVGTVQLVPGPPGASLPRVQWRVAVAPVNVRRMPDWLECFRLPPPFLTVHSIELGGEDVAVVSDAFVGVSAARAVVALKHAGRRLPLDVWFGLADRLLEALCTLDLQHPWWASWAGPHTFGVDFDGRFVCFAGFHGHAVCGSATYGPQQHALHSDWTDQQEHWGHTTAATPPVRVWSACRVLCWLLDPFPFRHEAPDSKHELEWAHPEVKPALAAVLEQGLSRRATGGLEGLRADLAQNVGVPAAPLERIKAVLFGAAEEALIARVRDVAAQDEALPERWKGGTLLVELDRTLEQVSNIAQCPVDPRVKVVPGAAVDEALLATRTLELQVLEAGKVLRKVPLSDARALLARVALPVGHVPAGPVTLRLVHPEQRAQSLDLEATLDGSAWVLPGALDAEQQRRLARFWAALVDVAPRALVKEREDPLEAIRYRVSPLEHVDRTARVLGPSLGVGLCVLLLFALGALDGEVAVKLFVLALIVNGFAVLYLALRSPRGDDDDDDDDGL
jgi:hypothetical protein